MLLSRRTIPPNKMMKQIAKTTCLYLLPLVMATAILVQFITAKIVSATSPISATTSPRGKSPIMKGKKPSAEIGKAAKGLPTPVAEMREAILAAARSGQIEELLLPIQWNELPPDFGDGPAKDPVAHFKAISVDGQGREILAILQNILSVPAIVVREGQDIENNQIFIWPYFARLPFARLTPAQKVSLLRILPRAEYSAMKKLGKYTYWSLTIGADGTWHAFRPGKTTANQ